MNKLKAIFLHNDNWKRFVDEHGDRMRPVVKKEVDKFLRCGEESNGFLTFKCEACPKVKKVPLRCKGKFCPTCAVGESQKWAAVQANDMYQTIHRHVILTVDEGLRSIFAG
ncbi:transposase zinc-binding domain-containing protein, partial [Alkalicoccus chagannorensis]|uniref:transposase zinc-binding domain-containing protein n=1 Tax=Alkalicoccus chagannorensis TaxID=427072 RepID=UPI0039EFF9BF